MRNPTLTKLLPLTASAVAMLGTASMAQAEISGNAGVVSQYIFRGVAEDNNNAFQGGLDYSHDSGFYAGTWFSTLSYDDPNANEVDLYAGFSGSSGEIGYDIGLLYFYYTGDATPEASVPEGYAAVGYGPVGLSANVALDTANWTAAGDTYVNLSFEQPLPDDFTFSANAGYYFYADDTENDDGSVSTAKSQDGAFRDATFSIAHPLAATGADMSINYTIGGENRAEEDLDDHFWAGVSFSF
ncbi:MAG TPA: TorF family putative porin [Gammaproteobacteria bacterium]|nr:TorF family putative porin [Gammaproteobacteria bacterium]